MIKHVTNHIIIDSENEKVSKIIHKKKSKSINKENLKKEKIISLNPLSNKLKKNIKHFAVFRGNQKNKKNLNLFFKTRKSKIEIDANKQIIKSNNEKDIKLNNENNKENYLTEKENEKVRNDNSKNMHNYKSQDYKREKFNKRKEKNLSKNNLFKKIKNQKNNIIEKLAQKEEEKGFIKNQITKNELIINKNFIEEIKNIEILKETEKKPEKINNKIEPEKQIIKEKEKKENISPNNDIPLLQLNDVNSSVSSLSIPNKKNNKSVSSEDLTESSYNSNNYLIKGELLSKDAKTNFLNNIKKCLFNKDINMNLEKDFSNSLKPKKSNKINLKQNLSTTELQKVDNNIKINSAFITKAGLDDKKEKINQDSFLTLEKIFENLLNIFGIFDGHGKNGHLISSLVSKFLNNYLSNKENYSFQKNNSDDSDSDSSLSSQDIIINNELLSKLFSTEDFIKNIINELDMKANESNFDLQFSGTTCLLLFILNDTLICSNIGDSMCVLFNCSNEDRWTHEVLSKIHKPDIETEKERILENGGVIHPYYDEFGIYDGPNRIYEKGKTYPGLSLTRSIGDLEGQKIGIISEPEIVVKKIDSTCKYIVMGSDGLWDVIKPYDVRRIVNSYFYKNDPKGACQALLKTACKNWEKSGCERDDITIIVIFIGTPN